MPEPRQTPVASRSECDVGFHCASERASCVAARAYCVKRADLWNSCMGLCQYMVRMQSSWNSAGAKRETY